MIKVSSVVSKSMIKYMFKGFYMGYLCVIYNKFSFQNLQTILFPAPIWLGSVNSTQTDNGPKVFPNVYGLVPKKTTYLVTKPLESVNNSHAISTLNLHVCWMDTDIQFLSPYFSYLVTTLNPTIQPKVYVCPQKSPVLIYPLLSSFPSHIHTE